MTAVAVMAIGFAVWLLVPSSGPGVKRLVPKVRSQTAINWWRAGFTTCVAGMAAAILVRPLAVVAMVGMVGTTLAWVVSARMNGRRAVKRRDEVVRVAQVLESLMGLGHLPSSALALAAEEYPMVAPAVAAQKMGGDPWEVMEQLSTVPGQEGLSQIGRAWRVSQVCGGSMHASLEQVRANLEEAQNTDSVVTGELAGPRATGQILAVLPLLGLGMAATLGVNPLGFLVGGVGGRACLMAGVGLICAGVIWSEILAQRAGSVGEETVRRKRRTS